MVTVNLTNESDDSYRVVMHDVSTEALFVDSQTDYGVIFKYTPNTAVKSRDERVTIQFPFGVVKFVDVVEFLAIFKQRMETGVAGVDVSGIPLVDYVVTAAWHHCSKSCTKLLTYDLFDTMVMYTLCEKGVSEIEQLYSDNATMNQVCSAIEQVFDERKY